MAHVLIVEDEPMIAESIAVLLEELGHQVTVTGMLAEAIEIAGQAQITCALLDINVSGGETTPVARALEGRGIHFVVMSGDATDTAGYGAAPVLQKPFRVHELEALIAKMLY